MENLHEYNKLAQGCANHNLQMLSSERVLVNERYDNGSQEPHNVKAYSYTYGCATCGATRTNTFINK